jgi:L-lactate dehydrogenase complex protein LldF
VGRQALHCIRCSACLNVCPVYERTGGHAYGSVYPGPIGAVLSPQLTGVEDNASLPYASSLCGACFDACPVKIDIPSILVHLRDEVPHPRTEKAAMAAAAYTMDHPKLYAAAQHAAKLSKYAGRRLPPPLNGWTASRDLPDPPPETFRDWWAKR